MPSRKGCPNKKPSKYDGMTVKEYFNHKTQKRLQRLQVDSKKFVKDNMENYRR